MLYRIDFQHFLTHAIDHFTLDQICHFEYVIISAKVANGRRLKNTVKVNELYPDTDIVINYSEFKDKEIMEKMYFEMLQGGGNKIKKKNYGMILYNVFVNPLIQHNDIMIVCDKEENDYIEALCKYLKKYFHIESINLNQLFTKGYVDEIYISMDKIRDSAVDIRIMAAELAVESYETTRGGREFLLAKMTRKEKIQKLKKLGIKVSAKDKDNIDELLIEEWVNSEDDE